MINEMPVAQASQLRSSMPKEVPKFQYSSKTNAPSTNTVKNNPQAYKERELCVDPQLSPQRLVSIPPSDR